MFSLEIAVVVLDLLYLLLVMLEKRTGWLIGVAGSILFVIANCYQELYMDAVLNCYYVIAGIYGWWHWGKDHDMPVEKFGMTNTFFISAVIVIASVIAGYFLTMKTHSRLSYLDSIVTLLSFLATWMATKKYIENWLVWIVADALGMLLYFMKGGILYPVLFAVYVATSVYAYFLWKKKMRDA